jgi:hypothetical protein
VLSVRLRNCDTAATPQGGRAKNAVQPLVNLVAFFWRYSTLVMRPARRPGEAGSIPVFVSSTLSARNAEGHYNCLRQYNGKCRRNYLAHNHEVVGSNPTRSILQNRDGSSAAEHVNVSSKLCCRSQSKARE